MLIFLALLTLSENQMLNKFLLALLFALALTACGDHSSSDVTDAELPPLTEEAPAEEAPAEEAAE